MVHVYVPCPKFEPDWADAFMVPVQFAVLLLIGQGP